MFIHLPALLIFLYFLYRVILPLKAGNGVKIAAALLLFCLSQQHFFYRCFLGGMASPELPTPVLTLLTCIFVWLLFLFILILLYDVTAFAMKKTSGKRSAAKAAFSPARRQVLTTCLAAVPAVYGVRQAVAVPEVHHLEARLPSLPRELDGLSLVQISDLHISSLLHAPQVRTVVEKVNALQPDLVVLTGDMVDGPPDSRAGGAAQLKELRARYGVFGCAGNHEYYADFHAWMKVFPTLGITMLLNNHKVIPVGGQNLVLAGVTDIVAKRYALPMPDISAALAGAPENGFHILMDHRPGGAAVNARAGVDLQLSGHTHGGQILGMTLLVAEYNEGYLSGWYQVGNMRLYVSPGAGLWGGFPVRLGVPSEIAAVTLRAG